MASFSRCQQYRYSLTRSFSAGEGCCVFIGLNPSTGNADYDDATIRRCMSFCVNWGYRHMRMVNLFAYRTPHPAQLKQAENPEGPGNRRALRMACAQADKIVAAWGNHGCFLGQAERLESIWSSYDLYCFGTTKSKQPLHPLYQPKNATLRPYVH